MKLSKLHLMHDNGGFLTKPTVAISTVSLVGGLYETAIMTEAGVEPIDEYDTMAKAVEGHQRWCRYYSTYRSATS